MEANFSMHEVSMSDGQTMENKFNLANVTKALFLWVEWKKTEMEQYKTLYQLPLVIARN